MQLKKLYLSFFFFEETKFACMVGAQNGHKQFP